MADHTDQISDVVYSSDGKFLATTGIDKTAKIWDATSGKLLREFEHDGRVQAIDFSPDGKFLVTAVLPKNISVLWEVDSGKKVRIFKGHTDWVYFVRFSPNGEYIATAGRDRVVKIWDVSTGKVIHNLPHASIVLGVDFSPDGKFLVSAGLPGELQETVIMWDVKTGRRVKSFIGPSNTVPRAKFSPNGQLLAAASWDRTVWIWDVSTGNEVRSLVHESAVHDIAFSPDNKMLGVACESTKPKTYYIYNEKDLTEEILLRAKNSVTRNLTLAERKIFLRQDVRLSQS